jgi:hypothetical protein
MTEKAERLERNTNNCDLAGHRPCFMGDLASTEVLRQSSAAPAWVLAAYVHRMPTKSDLKRLTAALRAPSGNSTRAAW